MPIGPTDQIICGAKKDRYNKIHDDKRWHNQTKFNQTRHNLLGTDNACLYKRFVNTFEWWTYFERRLLIVITDH